MFKKTVENFICEKCGVGVMGNGYTNHCPECLWSKHVDVYPGDRASICLGTMEPVGLEIKNGEERILHKCTSCSHLKPNVINKNDNRDKINELPLI